MPTLFFLHIPKCARMALADALIKQLPEGTAYQSTSMIRNFRENRPEFLEISEPKRLQAVVGHWLHESVMPALQRPIYLATAHAPWVAPSLVFVRGFADAAPEPLGTIP